MRNVTELYTEYSYLLQEAYITHSLERCHNMSTRKIVEASEVIPMEGNAIQPVTSLTPASVLGSSTKMVIADSLLPEEFQGQSLETLDSGFEPTVKWVNPGNFVGGTYLGFKENVGPNNSRLYSFEAGGKPFAIWGTTALDTMMNQGLQSGLIAFARKMLVIYMGDVETEKQPCKLFQIKVLKPK